MHSKQRGAPSKAIGSAHDAQMAVVIFGSAAQHPAQHDAVRARHGSSPSQTTQAACRTIRAVSRPNIDSVCNTTPLYFEGSRFR